MPELPEGVERHSPAISLGPLASTGFATMTTDIEGEWVKFSNLLAIIAAEREDRREERDALIDVGREWRACAEKAEAALAATAIDLRVVKHVLVESGLTEEGGGVGFGATVARLSAAIDRLAALDTKGEGDA